MKEIDINLSNVTVINSFLNTVSRFDENLFIKSGNYMVDARSPIGLFVCDLSKPMKLLIHSNEERILPVVERYRAAS